MTDLSHEAPSSLITSSEAKPMSEAKRASLERCHAAVRAKAEAKRLGVPWEPAPRDRPKKAKAATKIVPATEPKARPKKAAKPRTEPTIVIEATPPHGSLSFSEGSTFGPKPKRPMSELQKAALKKAQEAAREMRQKTIEVPAKPKRATTNASRAAAQKARRIRAANARARKFLKLTGIPSGVTPESFWAAMEETRAICAGSKSGAHWAKQLEERREAIERGAKGNLTSQWLAKNGREIREMLIEHLSHKLPISRRISVVEDHVQTFLARLVERDTLGEHLAAGRVPQQSVLRIWAYQTACTDMRGWGVDASLRKSRGAKTNRDRQADAGERPPVVVQSATALIEVRRFEVENGEVVTELHDPNAVSIEDHLASNDLMDLARNMLSSRKNRGSKYRALVESLFANDEQRASLALKLGASREQLNSILARLREVVREETPD
jgi:hypothetical protein